MNVNDGLFPKITPEKQKIPFTLRAGTEESAALFRKTNRLAVWNVSGITDNGVRRTTYYRNLVHFERCGTSITFFFTPESEGEYCVSLCRTEHNDTMECLKKYHFYALGKDLFSRTPFRGDFHLHSTRSDGVDAPERIPALCRRAGMDFLALTDHRKYGTPPPDADDPETPKIFPGEEIHLPGNPVHIVGFGHSRSIGELAAADPESREQECAKIESELSCADPVVRRMTARSEWTFQKIREFGGLSVFCHPFWRPDDHFQIGESVTDSLLERGKFDILELFGGFYLEQMESNQLSLARWSEARAHGAECAVAGVSDTHDSAKGLMGWYSTIVFAESREFSHLAEAFRRGDSLALRTLPGEFPLLAGPWRLVKFGYFLLREYFPRHDEICRAEGEAMLRRLDGIPDIPADVSDTHTASVRRVRAEDLYETIRFRAESDTQNRMEKSAKNQ